ncbi:cytochrome P450 [Vreelandella aquamarina]|uniref:hypothetical protein n=1 Tax=Vreelandella aquamarina TaxID=77097 RepID=UPI0038501450
MPASNPTSSNFAFLNEHDTFVAILKGAELSLPPVNPARLRRVGGLLREAALRLWPTTPVIPACF